MPADTTALLPKPGEDAVKLTSYMTVATGASAGAGEQPAAPWCGSEPMHMVDVQRVDEALEANPGLELPTMCFDKHAAAMLVRIALFVALCVVAPIVGFTRGVSLLHSTDGHGIGALVVAVSALLVAVGCASCCCLLEPVISVSIKPPPPAACVSPLLARSANTTHRSGRSVKRVALVYNPHSGKRMAQDFVRDVLAPKLAAREVQVEPILTERVNHAREIGRLKDLTGLDGLLVMGGDGTLHELVNGVIARPDSLNDTLPPLAVVPLGSGNAYAAHFRQSQRNNGVETSVYQDLNAMADWALDRVVGGNSCCADVIEVTTKGQKLASVCLIMMGLLGEADVLSEPLRCIGPMRMDIVGIWGMLKHRPMHPCRIDLIAPDGSSQRLTNIVEEGGSPWLCTSVSLCQHWTETMRASPTSIMDDGTAELMIVYLAPRGQILKGFTLLDTGAHVNLDNVDRVVETFAFKELSMEFPNLAGGAQETDLGIFNVDGEVFCHDGSIHLKVLPRRLRIFCDPQAECAEP